MRGIRRSKVHSELVDRFDQRNSVTQQKVFPFKKATMCYAAILGFKKNKRVPLPEGNIDTIEWHTFENGSYTDYIYLIALAHAKDVDVLRYDVEKSDAGGFKEDMVTIFEEYANGGLEIMQSWLSKKPGDAFGNEAIIAGLKREGFLNLNKPVEAQTFDTEVF